MTNNQIFEEDKRYVSPTYARFDVAFERGEGARLYDLDGREYIDCSTGIGVNIFGICDEVWKKAVTDQINKIQHTSNLYYSLPQTQLAKLLCEKTGAKKVFFGNSGAEANEAAIKTARKYGSVNKGIEKNRIITLNNSFHGRTMATITATGQEGYHKFFTPFPDGFDYCDANDIDQLKELVSDDTCAIMMEMIQGEGGVLNLDAGFVKAVEGICAEKDILFIADEVQTGIGRTGKLFAYEYFGVKPDIVTFAKGIGGGLPIGGALFSEKCCDVLEPGNHGTTYGGNPVACAGAVEVLTRIDDVFLEDVTKKGEYLREKLLDIPQVKSVSGMGLMLGAEIEGKEAGQVVKDALEMGLMILTAKDRVRMLPPLTITYDELDAGLEILKKALA